MLKLVMTRFAAVFLLIGGVSVAGCNSASTPSPTTPTTTATSVTQVLNGTIMTGTVPFHSFTVPSTAPLHIMFGSLTSPTEAPLGSSVTLIYGITSTDGVTCLPLTKVSATAALKAQINVTASAAEYCLSLDDFGAVPDGSLYAIRVIYGTPSEATSSGDLSFNSSVLAGGSTARSFPAANAGIAVVALDDILPASVPNLGVALGFQRNDGSGCQVTFAYSAPRGFATGVPIDPGRYCVKVFDPGTLTNTAAFTLRLSHP